MMKKQHAIILLTLLIGLLLLLLAPLPASAQTPLPVVRAVLFYSPSCGHCHYVITEVLPPLFEQYGQQLEILPVDASDPAGNPLFLDTMTKFGLERAGVPFLVIDNIYLIGSKDIPEQLPGLIEYYLAEGGVDWPALPGLVEYMAVARSTQLAVLNPGAPTSTEIPTGTLPAVGTPIPQDSAITPQPTPGGGVWKGIQERLALDPAGNALAILVLVGMLLTLGWGVWFMARKPGRRLSGWLAWIIPALCLVGLVVAGYLTYVETLQVEAWCGVVGDCNTVQQSEYARLVGILPIGVLGIAGYLIILVAWAGMQFLPGKLSEGSALLLLLLTVFGALFSTYLTFLEPFVIGATCMWCLTSAVISTLLFVLAVPPGKLALKRMFRKKN